MIYVYFLKKQNAKHIYTGLTKDLKDRMRHHKYTSPGYKLIYYEAYLSERDARKREKQLKQYGSALGHLKRRLSDTLYRV